MGLFRKGMQNYDEYDWSIARQLNPLSPIPQSDLQDSTMEIGPTEFHGVLLNLQDGSTEFVPAEPEFKKEFEEYLNEHPNSPFISFAEAKARENYYKSLEDSMQWFNYLGR